VLGVRVCRKPQTTYRLRERAAASNAIKGVRHAELLGVSSPAAGYAASETPSLWSSTRSRASSSLGVLRRGRP